MNLKRNSQKGFTIIEVVLVLAIAGLIFLMVFLALPALQRSQRDSQRKTDLNRAYTALTQYKGAHRGKLPDSEAAWKNFRGQYLAVGNDSFVDPQGKQPEQPVEPEGEYYRFVSKDAVDIEGDFKKNQNIIYYTIGAKCTEGGSVEGGQGTRVVALRMKLEGAGVICFSD